MQPKKLCSDTYWLGAVDWDRRMFDELIPLPEGTTYNAYLVKGSRKTALIDTVDPTYTHILLRRLEALNVRRIDYVVANHAEQDHSGSLPVVLERFPEAKVVATPKCQAMLIDLLGIAKDVFLTAEDGMRLELGDKTLRFLHFPWVHWPETMLTYLEEERVLFPCDLFGSHLALADVTAPDPHAFLPAAKRYYAQIMMPFRKVIAKNLPLVQALELDMIAPSHGPVIMQPSTIVDAYVDWLADSPKNHVVLAYTSMHASTRQMALHLTEALSARNVYVEPFNLLGTDMGRLAMALVDAATVVFGSPTVSGGPHPLVAYAAYLANLLKPKARFSAVLGSYGWGGKMSEQLALLMPALKLESLGTVLAKGYPKQGDLEALDRLADAIAEKHREL